jgi:hypothetical protein
MNDINEYDIATTKVRRYLIDTLRWPDQLISNYGRVPVKIGGATVWADLVCYISDHQKASPWLLVEIKRPRESLEQAVPQAESYAIILGARFFAVTDGDDYQFYVTGGSQGRSLQLDGYSLLPTTTHLNTGAQFVYFPPILDSLVEQFVIGLRREAKFLDDTKNHDRCIKQLNHKIFRHIGKITKQDLKQAIEDYVMMKPPNRNTVYAEIDKNFSKVKNFLTFLAEFSGDPVENINYLCNESSPIKIRGGGIFFITQLLASAHLNKYVVLEENVSRALRHLGITDILVQNDTGNGYVYINEICKKLWQDKLSSRLKEFDFGMSAPTHNFLWHYYVYFRKNGTWSQ